MIVSNDAGFDHIIDFWKADTGAKASRAQKVGMSGDVVDYVTQVVEKNVNNKNKKQQIYNHIRKQI